MTNAPDSAYRPVGSRGRKAIDTAERFDDDENEYLHQGNPFEYLDTARMAASWAGSPHVKGSSEAVRMMLLTFSLVGLQ